VYGQRTQAALRAIGHCRHPVIAEIHGLCVGGGLELAVYADMRLCGESSRFAIPPKKLGLVVAHEELHELMHLVGYSNALEILFEGRLLDSAHALRIGLVNRVVADEQVAQNALDSARNIASGAPLVARWHKQFARRLLDPTPLTSAEVDEAYHCFDTEDFQIGYQAFLAKQKPVFKGK
jgi:enoyl-CoA hydratase/carnithine racemase